mmetsp:Transcript_57629/g.187214  ORF Transcript_57629/g.187214 Transcript_57629/m.187214 type:complete len:237 (+) Transcript_57629:1217-1927(+)
MCTHSKRSCGDGSGAWNVSKTPNIFRPKASRKRAVRGAAADRGGPTEPGATTAASPAPGPDSLRGSPAGGAVAPYSRSSSTTPPRRRSSAADSAAVAPAPAPGAEDDEAAAFGSSEGDVAGAHSRRASAFSKGVSPSGPAVSGHAPPSSKALTTSQAVSPRTARRSGVRPSPSADARSAPFFKAAAIAAASALAPLATSAKIDAVALMTERDPPEAFQMQLGGSQVAGLLSRHDTR